MTNREYVKSQIDFLPDTVLEQVQEFISFKLYSLGMLENDNEYLRSVPGMSESIQEGINTPLSECIDMSEVWPDV